MLTKTIPSAGVSYIRDELTVQLIYYGDMLISSVVIKRNDATYAEASASLGSMPSYPDVAWLRLSVR